MHRLELSGPEGTPASALLKLPVEGPVRALVDGLGAYRREVTFYSQLSGEVAAKILIAGFVTCTLPPIIVWAIGLHMMKINPAILMGGVAGARSHSGPAREAAKEIGSSVPWIGFPVGYAVSGILLTVFGYVAMIMSK